MIEKQPVALLFDVFGTCVDWRKTVTSTLQHEYALVKSKTNTTGTPDMSDDDWGLFAQQWRNSYKQFIASVWQKEEGEFKTIDEHHLDSLKELLVQWRLEGIWDDNKIKELSLIWHYLDPWADTSEGITALNQLTQTATLSNGNTSLLEDLCKHAKMEMKYIFSAETFKHYKPHSATYLGAVGKVGAKPEEVAMVAAHLNDLQVANHYGLKTIYVARAQEEDWDQEKVEKTRQEGWVDIWIEEGEDGFLQVAQHLARLQSGS